MPPGPLRELNHLVDEILAEEELLHSLEDDLAVLFRKLPVDYRQGAGAFEPSKSEHLRRIVVEAHAMLIQGLKKEGHGE